MHFLAEYKSLVLNSEHKNTLHNPTGEDITQIQRREFPKWFKERVRNFESCDTLNSIKQLYSFLTTNVTCCMSL